MGSIAEPLLLEHTIDIPSKVVGQQLAMVAEEDTMTRLSDTSPETEGHDDSSSDHAVSQRSAKRQRTGFSCEACHMTFTEKRALARHKKTDHHRKQLGLPPDRKHACITCGKHFTRGHDLKRHQNEQHQESTPGETSTLRTESSGTSDATGTSDASSELPSIHSSPIRSVSQASSATDNTSIFAVIEPPSNVITKLPEGIGTNSTRLIAGLQEQEHRTLRHYQSAPNIGSGASRVEQGHYTDRPTSMLVDEDLLMEDIETYGGSDLGGDDAMDDLNEVSASVRRLPIEYTANPELLANLPTHPFAISSRQTAVCALCSEPFEDDPDELLKHLRRHFDSFNGASKCKKCQIDFAHEEDLQRHLQSAANGHCGFNFPHSCMGHHPPLIGDRSGSLSDYDRVRLCVRLQNWEQARLQAYIAEIGDLTAARQTRKLARWSDVFRGGPCRNSFSSFAISVNSYATAPCDSSDGQTDIGGLQQRMKHMSLGKAGNRVRRLIHPGSSDVRTRTLDRQLEKAIKHGDPTKLAQLLESGADAHIIHEHTGPFIAMVLWGIGHISGLLTEHRLDEDIVGSCSVCEIGTERFEKGTYKVQALLRHEADPNQPGGLCGYPLATAAWMGKSDLVRLLLSSGADIQTRRGRYGTALCAAAAQAGYTTHRDVIGLLIRRGADVHARGPEGTALELARRRKVHWLKQYTSPSVEVQSRIACCDQVIAMLEAEEQKPFKRSVTPALDSGYGGIKVIGAASKLTFSHPRLRHMRSWGK